ncbi:MAG: hypothetical protein LW623_00305 [Sphingomonadaceae bacterium]|jgi:hypothetical protein|uniref:hypothetical protein n=1 Tax=Sphingorhabdus sp. TaxID=1902408 RepID=UPI0039BCDD25|nr:hypothetical protein [Sphingomonadaceae bacterium]
MTKTMLKDKEKYTFHHLSIPTAEPKDNEVYAPHLKANVVLGTANAYGISWARYDADADVPELIKTVAHPAFEVENLEEALDGETVIVPPVDIEPGVRSAFVNMLDAPVRLMQIDHNVADEKWTNPVTQGGKKLIYHHTGMPGCDEWEGETKVPHLNLAFLPGKLNTYGVEWLRFGEGNKNPDVIKFTPHIAFEVEDIDQAIVGEKVIYHSGRDDSGIIVSFVEVDGASVEFLELNRDVCGEQFDR